MPPGPTIARRARLHAALGDPVRLLIVDELMVSDRAPVELQALTGLASNLLAHHLDTLEQAGLIARSDSSGDGRRRYIRLISGALGPIYAPTKLASSGVLFVCSMNSARSQLAAALWNKYTGAPAQSAGTHPAHHVHPGAIAAARRAGFDLRATTPRSLENVETLPPIVITVCDQAPKRSAHRKKCGRTGLFLIQSREARRVPSTRRSMKFENAYRPSSVQPLINKEPHPYRATRNPLPLRAQRG